ncbi:MAG: hypothetical protein LLG04_11530 [Parachlamydia sp.]|nr:hypothetical protein [Parachlamydia sp.]
MISASPLEHYSSLHEMSLLGLDSVWSHFFLEFDFNFHTPLHLEPNVYLTFHTLDEDNLPSACCYSMTQLKRWRMDITPYISFDDYLNSLIRWHFCNYVKSEKVFKEYGCKVKLIENDWTHQAEVFYQLYLNILPTPADAAFGRLFQRGRADQ